MDSPAQNISLDSEAFSQLTTPESEALLDSIDKLRELRVGNMVSLPQIIVVGDQSSGKSSVLEAISCFRFPVDEDVCTRFATELILRRGSENKIDVSIRLADATHSQTPGDTARKPFRRSSFDKDALSDIISEAKGIMGIQQGDKTGFSKDILCVEISGPDIICPLTLVDLPGLFHSATADQTSEDKQLVHQLVESYMAQKRSLILAVVAANNQLANQVIIGMAKDHDKNRERTIGVITKPDLAGQRSRKFLDCVNGLETDHKLDLGWFVLRNRAEDEDAYTADERDLKEQEFFQSGNWRSVPPTKRGVSSLRKKLSKVLLDHIKTNLPGLVNEINDSLMSRQEELRRLGKPRSTPNELRLYLHELADRFQNLARDAIDGRYTDTKFFGDMDQKDKKLRAELRNLNCAFDVTMVEKGMTYEIDEEEDDDDDDDDDEKGVDSDGENDRGNDGNEQDDPTKYLRPYLAYFTRFDNPKPITKTVLKSKLAEAACVNQGRELPGIPSSDLALQLFRMQAKPWRDIAQFHVLLVLDFTKVFLEQAFKHIIGASRPTLSAILSRCLDPFIDEKRNLLNDKLDELLRPFTNGFWFPLEAEFHRSLSKATLRRLADQITDNLANQHPAKGSKPNTGLSRTKVFQAIREAEVFSSSKFGTENIIDMMVAYYDMSRRTFTDNVINLAIESCLICDIPERVLTPGMVFHMSEDRLQELASEPEEDQDRRLLLENEVKVLEEGLKKCRESTLREITVAPLVATRTPHGERQRESS